MGAGGRREEGGGKDYRLGDPQNNSFRIRTKVSMQNKTI